MGTGAITEYVDVAQLALYAFWILFFLLVGYLHREGKREGWPLQMSSGELRTGVGGMPPPKTYRLAHGQGYRLVLQPPLQDFPSGDAERDAARVNAVLEAQIAVAPEQYFWAHKRFKTRPPGEPSVY